ncbi:MAG: dihydrodipicolinate synthase family protein [Sphaerochaetaceae bacterium]|nr:dihydrodipicolinate synthase family protein [Sphaerochaetaceae bacterium]
MINLEKFKNVFVAFYTPYDDDGDVSPERTKALVDYFYSKGIRGLYITGSSGESPYLNVEERKTIMKSAMESAKGKMTVIAHVGAASTRDSIILAKYAKELECDAISSVPPIYFSLSEQAISDYWTAMIEASQLPFIIYNIPQTTGTNISKKLFKSMLQNELTIGIKNTSLPVMDIQQFKEIGGERCIVFNGPDEQFAAGRLMGADGGIGGTYGVMPELFLKIDEFIRKGDFKLASELQRITTGLIFEILAAGGMFGACKYILKLRGMDIGEPRGPLPKLTKENKRTVEQLEQKISNVIHDWCDKN